MRNADIVIDEFDRVLKAGGHLTTYAKPSYMKKSHTESDQAEGMRGENVCEIFLYEKVAYKKWS